MYIIVHSSVGYSIVKFMRLVGQHLNFTDTSRDPVLNLIHMNYAWHVWPFFWPSNRFLDVLLIFQHVWSCTLCPADSDVMITITSVAQVGIDAIYKYVFLVLY